LDDYTLDPSGQLGYAFKSQTGLFGVLVGQETYLVAVDLLNQVAKNADGITIKSSALFKGTL
jgi:hypothetical protein